MAYNVGMKIFALDFSTEQASLALLEDGAVIARLGFQAGFRNSQTLFPTVRQLLEEAHWSWDDVEAFAVGRGPGSYTGLRVAMTAAQGWALPGDKPVWAVSSAAAAAAEWLAGNMQAPAVVVWGPSRKGQLWAGRFMRGAEGRVEQTDSWQLMPEAEKGSIWMDTPWMNDTCRPTAEWVGRLFFAGQPGEDTVPVYLHEAVAIAPRFDAEGRPIT